jgi:hypothetical protein
MPNSENINQKSQSYSWAYLKERIDGIPGFRYVFMRIYANILMFIALIFCFADMISAITASNHSNWLILGPFLAVLPFYFMHLSQNDFIDNQRALFLIIGFLSGFGLLAGLFYFTKASFELFLSFYAPISFAIMGLIIGRHYVLSIYRVQKKYYFISLTCFFTFWLAIGWPLMGANVLTSVIITAVAVLLNAYGEYRLCERRLMHFL